MNFSMMIFGFVEGFSFLLGFVLLPDKQEEKRPFWAAENAKTKIRDYKIKIIFSLNTMNS